MRLTRKAEYAIRTLLYLSARKFGEKVLAREIASEMHIPQQFLAQIMLVLNQAGFVYAIRGVNGGFVLAKEPSKISLKEVIEAIEGKVSLNKCLISEDLCPNVEVCPVHEVWEKAQEQLLSVLARCNFANLAKKARSKLKETGQEKKVCHLL